MLHMDNWQFARQVSLIARLKHMNQTIESLCKTNAYAGMNVSVKLIKLHVTFDSYNFKEAA